MMRRPYNVSLSRAQGLLADTKLLLGDDCTVAVDVLSDQVVEKTTTLTYKCLKSARSGIIFVI